MLDQIAKKVGLHQREAIDLAVDREFQKIEIDYLTASIAKREDIF